MLSVLYFYIPPTQMRFLGGDTQRGQSVALHIFNLQDWLHRCVYMLNLDIVLFSLGAEAGSCIRPTETQEPSPLFQGLYVIMYS